MTETKFEPMTRMASARQFVLGAVWVLMSFTVAALAAKFVPAEFAPFFVALVEALLLAIGFSIFATIFDHASSPLAYIGLPRRSTFSREWLIGLAIGWGIITAIVLPMVLAKSAEPSFDLSIGRWNLLVIELATAAAIALVEELAFRGYAFQRLTEAIGEAWATVAVSVIFALMQFRSGEPTLVFAFSIGLFNLLCCLAWLRTRALWLGWGLRFGWFAVTGILFGMPVNGDRHFNSVIITAVGEPTWLTGGFLGPMASAIAPIVLLIAVYVLMRATRDLAWEYTFRPVEGGGYPMTPPPPPEHTRMEEEAKAKMSALVQIAPVAAPSSDREDRPRAE